MQARTSTFADFGPRLSAAIKARLGNEAEAARRTGITPQAINTYVRESRLPKAEQLYALSQELSVTMEFLLTGRDAAGRASALPDAEGIRREERHRLATRLRKLLVELET